MKNSLEKFVEENSMDSVTAMNLLQGKGCVISDNCVELSDVAEADCAVAVEFLKKYLPKWKR